MLEYRRVHYVKQIFGMLPTLSMSVDAHLQFAGNGNKGKVKRLNYQNVIDFGFILMQQGYSYRGKIRPAYTCEAVSWLTNISQDASKSAVEYGWQYICEGFQFATQQVRTFWLFPYISSTGLRFAFSLAFKPIDKLDALLGKVEIRCGKKIGEFNPADTGVKVEESLALGIAKNRIAGLEEAQRRLEMVTSSQERIIGDILQRVPFRVFVNHICEELYQVAGMGRCVAMFYDSAEDALVGTGVVGAPDNQFAQAREAEANTAEIIAFNQGRLVIPLSSEGQAKLGKTMFKRAAELIAQSLRGGASVPGLSVALRVVRGLKVALRREIALQQVIDLPEDQRKLWDEHIHVSNSHYEKLNALWVARGWTRTYKLRDDGKYELELSKHIVIGPETQRVTKKVILCTLCSDDIEWRQFLRTDREFRFDDQTQEAAMQRMLDLQACRILPATAQEALDNMQMVTYEGEAERKSLTLDEWKDVYAAVESLLIRSFKEGRTLVVQDTADPEHPISKILIRMWGSAKFVVMPIIAPEIVRDPVSGEFKMARKVVGVFAMDHDQAEGEITDAMVRQLESLRDAAALGFVMQDYVGKLSDAFGEHAGRVLMEAAIAEKMVGDKRLLEAKVVDNCSVMFVDVCRSTGIPAKLAGKYGLVEGAKKFFELLVDYRNHIDEIIEEEEGILDKYIGDGHMVVWNIPLKSHSDAAERAVRAAINMHRAADSFMRPNTKWRPVFDELGIDFAVRTGVYTGQVIAGVLESKQKSEYTVVGDTVNRAKRFEDAARGARGILISTGTYDALSREFIEGYIRECNQIVREWLIGDGIPAEILDQYFTGGFVHGDIFCETRVPIKIDDKEVLDKGWEIEWDRKRLMHVACDRILRGVGEGPLPAATGSAIAKILARKK